MLRKKGYYIVMCTVLTQAGILQASQTEQSMVMYISSESSHQESERVSDRDLVSCATSSKYIYQQSDRFLVPIVTVRFIKNLRYIEEETLFLFQKLANTSLDQSLDFLMYELPKAYLRKIDLNNTEGKRAITALSITSVTEHSLEVLALLKTFVLENKSHRPTPDPILFAVFKRHVDDQQIFLTHLNENNMRLVTNELMRTAYIMPK